MGPHSNGILYPYVPVCHSTELDNTLVEPTFKDDRIKYLVALTTKTNE